MKFVQNNKILEDSNAENAEISAEKTKSKSEEAAGLTPSVGRVRRTGLSGPGNPARGLCAVK